LGELHNSSVGGGTTLSVRKPSLPATVERRVGGTSGVWEKQSQRIIRLRVGRGDNEGKEKKIRLNPETSAKVHQLGRGDSGGGGTIKTLLP